MKKSVSILLMLLAILLVPILAWATQADASFKFSLDASGDAVITGYVGSAIDVTIPETLAGHRVTAIGEAAFMNKDTLTGISLPDGILSIDRSAFKNCRSAVSINIPITVRKIGANAFENCFSLVGATVPEGITALENRVFLNCHGLQRLTLPRSLETIGDGSLAGLHSLKELELPKALRTIGLGAFASGKGLESLVIPSSVTDIGYSAFHGSENLKRVVLSTGMQETLGGLFHGCPDLEEVSFPDNIRRIDPGMLFTSSPKVSVHGFVGSAAQVTANALRIPFVPIESIREVKILLGNENATGQLKGIDLSSAQKELQFSAQVSPDSPWPGVDWKSTAPTIAGVDAYGVVTGNKSGKATIVASAVDGSGVSAQIQINVANLVKGVTVSGETEMKANQNLVLTVAVVPEQADNKQVSWTSSHPDILSVAKNGKAAAAKRVPAITIVTLTAQATDGSGVSGNHEVTVYPLAYGISLKANDRPVEEKGTIGIDLSSGDPTVQLVAAVIPADAMQDVTWKSSANRVATVTETGLVAGLKKGSANITVSAQDGSGIKATYKVNVSNLVSEIVITGSDAVASGKSITLKASALPDAADNKRVTWTSSDPDIAKVSTTGKVTAQKTGSVRQVQISATAKDGSGVVATHDVTVHPAATSVLISAGGMALGEKTTVTMDLGTGVNTLQLEGTTEPQDAAQGVTWKSSNTGVATVDENGLLTGHKRGTATITATAQDGSNKKASFKIKVMTLAKEITITGDATVQGGDWIRLKAAFTPDTTDNKRVSWSGSDKEAATVTREGVVNAKRVKTATTVTITATAQDESGVTAQYDITVLP